MVRGAGRDVFHDGVPAPGERPAPPAGDGGEVGVAPHKRCPEGNVGAYAYARTGYHRGLDALRRAGWKGSGPIPWEHAPNRGFLRCVAALAQAAGQIGETDEYQRCVDLLDDCDPEARPALGLA